MGLGRNRISYCTGVWYGHGFTHSIYILYEIMMKILYEITLNVRIMNL